MIPAIALAMAMALRPSYTIDNQYSINLDGGKDSNDILAKVTYYIGGVPIQSSLVAKIDSNDNPTRWLKSLDDVVTVASAENIEQFANLYHPNVGNDLLVVTKKGDKHTLTTYRNFIIVGNTAKSHRQQDTDLAGKLTIREFAQLTNDYAAKRSRNHMRIAGYTGDTK